MPKIIDFINGIKIDYVATVKINKKDKKFKNIIL